MEMASLLNCFFDVPRSSLVAELVAEPESAALRDQIAAMLREG